MYEPDFDDIINNVPIYHRQFQTLKRLTNLPDEKLFALTSEEAKTFINSLREKYIRNSFTWLHKRAKIRKAQEALFGSTDAQVVSAATEVLASQITVAKRSK